MALGDKHIYETTIVEHHLDTFGHVNNATYLEILEDARWDLITSRGFGLETIKEKRVGPTILEINIQFRRELKNREKIRIETQCESYEGRIGVIVQTIFNQAGQEACIAKLTIGLFDVVARKLILPTPEWLRAVGLESS